MARTEDLLARFEKTYQEVKAKEVEELHNSIVSVLNEHKAATENILYVLDLVRFEIMEAKYKEIMGVVKLTDKLPIKKAE